MSYAKLFSSMLDSTIWLEDSETRIVWITILLMADATGYVGAAIPGVAARARVPVSTARLAIERLLGPDPDSRDSEHGGRRIAKAFRGWVILNHAKFRGDPGDRRQYWRERRKAHRDRAKERKLQESGVNVPDSQGQVLDMSTPHSARTQVDQYAPPELRPDPDQGSDPQHEEKNPGDPISYSGGESLPADRNRSPHDGAPTVHPVLVFPCRGRVPTWDLTDERLAELAGLHPGIDALLECKKACAWCKDNPGKRKTARGMATFLHGWLERARPPRTATNGAGAAHLSTTQAREARNDEVARAFLARSRGMS